MSTLAKFTSIVHELAEASLALLEVDKLRPEAGGDPIWNTMMDGAADRLRQARQAFDAWEELSSRRRE